MERKKTQGRKKIEMKMITDENARRITFSKRRHGLFKKASQLCTLCGVDIAIVLFSLGGKAFSFGNPSVDFIVDRFLNRAAQPNDQGNPRLAMPHQEGIVHQLNQQFHELNKRLEAEKNREKMSQNMRGDHEPLSCGLDAYINQLGVHQLEQLKRSMEELKENVAQRVDELLSEDSSKHVQEEGVSNTEKNDNDASTIPHDWLRL